MKEKHVLEYEDGHKVLLDEDDVPELSEEDFARMRPAQELLPAAFWNALHEGKVGRPKKENKKQTISLRLDPDIIAWLRAQEKYNLLVSDLLRNAMQNAPCSDRST